MGKLYRVGIAYLLAVTIISLAHSHIIVANAQTPLYSTNNLKPLTFLDRDRVYLYEKFAPIFLLNNSIIYVIDFTEIDNSSLSKLLVKTAYSTVTSIPSNQVYVKNGCLYLSSTSHLIINTTWLNITLPSNYIIEAHIVFISGGGPSYGRGGVGLYENVTFDPISGVYPAANYWLSVLGSFASNGPLSYDFEGHIPWKSGQWCFSETIDYNYYLRGVEYIVWIARLDNYVIGGIKGGFKNWILYMNVSMALPEIVAYQSTVCFKKIVFRRVGIGYPINQTVIIPILYLDYNTWASQGYVLIRVTSQGIVLDPGYIVHDRVYYYISKTVYVK